MGGDKVEFKAAKCPNCGGNLQLPNNIENVKCLYCGSDIIVRDAIRKVEVENIASADNLLKLAEEARKSNNNKLAYEYYNKYLELDFNNYKAWYGKAISSGWGSSLASFNAVEIIQGIRKAIELVPEDKKGYLEKEASYEINTLATSFYKLALDNFQTFISLESFNTFTNQILLIVEMYKVAHELDANNIAILNNIVEVTLAYTKTYEKPYNKGKVFPTEYSGGTEPRFR